MNLAALGVVALTAPVLLLLAHQLPLLVARRLSRRHGVVHVGNAAERALPRLRHLVIEAEHVVTTGHLVVIDVQPIDERHQRDLRWFAGALAHKSTDPIARAIARLSGPGRTTGVGHGPHHELQGSVDRHPVRIGLQGLDQDDDAAVGTTVRVDVDSRPMGHITVAEEVRKVAAHGLAALRSDGVAPVLVSAALAKPDLARVADEVEVDDYHPGADAAHVAATMPTAATGTLCAVASSDGVVGELTLPHGPGEDTVVRCTSPAIDSVLGSLQLLRALRRARRTARVCAVVFAALGLAAAAAGLLSVTMAAAVAAADLLIVACVAALTTMTGAADTGHEDGRAG